MHGPAAEGVLHPPIRLMATTKQYKKRRKKRGKKFRFNDPLGLQKKPGPEPPAPQAPGKKKRKHLRQILWERDKGHCWYCGAFSKLEGKPEEIFTIEHVVPLAHGGLNTPENCVTACGDCNREAADMDYNAKVFLRAQKRHGVET